MPSIIEKISPPTLKPQTILQKIASRRPMRDKKFMISTEIRGSKRLVHCYGHGGSGWTTLFGSVAKAIDLFQQEKIRAPIRVIGAGCIGLVAAIELSRMGYEIAGITAKELYDIPSWQGGGYFAFVSVKTSPEEQENLEWIGAKTFRAYAQIHKGEHPYIPSHNLRYLPIYCSKDTPSGLEELVEQGLIPEREEVVLDFGNGARHEDFLRYQTYFMDTTGLMKTLTREVQRLRIPIEVGEVHSFDELREEIIFNCSGLGAGLLNHDEAMIPVRGHLLLLNGEAGSSHMDYLIYTKLLQEEKEEYLYLFPKTLAVSSAFPSGLFCSGLIGGTFIPHDDHFTPAELADLDRLEFQRMYDRASRFFHG